MSHEIRTPLYGVLGSLELLSLTALDTQQHQQVERIRGASHQLLQIISDVLDITRIEAGQLQINIEPFDPVMLVEDCVAAFAAMAQRKGLLLFSCVAPDTPSAVMGDVQHVRQILNNLISNAVKFTQAGHVIVRLHAASEEADCHALRFQVVDSGIGITREQQVDLFKPFYLVHADNHTVRGAGLGLSICDRLARLMDSQVQVVSEPGLGSSFSFELALGRVDGAESHPAPDLRTLGVRVRAPHAELAENLSRWLAHWGATAQAVPLAQEPSGGVGEVLLDVQMPSIGAPSGWLGAYMSLSPQDGASTHPGIDGFRTSKIGLGLGSLLGGGPPAGDAAAETRGPCLDRPGVRILVVEDNPINLVTLRDQLEQLGCQVTVAEDGEDALSLWAIGRYDMVLTDINMPRVNGYELARQLRGQGERVPIVGLTANAMWDEALRCRQSGMDAWMVKPIDLRSLCGLLNKLQPRSALPASGEEGERKAGPIEDRYRTVFRQTMMNDLDQLRQALEQGRAEVVARLLHRMRGALVVVGWTDQARELGILEDALKGAEDEAAILDKVRRAQEALRAQVDLV
jgi:two-component system capsular synthesis sensor histidine kinase RcsC